jgi:DNA-binding response OmpR family regulator
MADAPSVVLVEDDIHIADLVSLYLDQSGFRVYRADNGADGLRTVAERDPRLVILDVGLPGEIDGLELCRRLRTTSNVPVIMLTARDGEIDRVLGLELGADDYVTKPFSPRELVARVKAILRRADGAAQAHANGAHKVLTSGDVEVDTGRAEARVDGSVIPLTTREFALLLYLAENKGLALSRRQLLDGAWGADWYGDERTVDVHVRQLRKKMGDALPLTTVRGIGYRLE